MKTRVKQKSKKTATSIIAKILKWPHSIKQLESKNELKNKINLNEPFNGLWYSTNTKCIRWR
jgi:hypothetical protein